MEENNPDPIAAQEESYGINVTPLVDVSLVLVLIFMVTSPFFLKDLLQVNLPEATSLQMESRKNITVSVSAAGEMALNEIPVTSLNVLSFELSRAIKKEGSDVVLLRADGNVPSGDVQDILKIIKKAGARRVAFATQPRLQ
jgi:biopolymer transport protein ExbD